MLTFIQDSGILKIIKELLAVDASDIGDFLYPNSRGIRAENILNIGQASNRALIASPAFAKLKWLLKTIGGPMRHIFNYNQTKIRTTIINNQPWFCLADCATALGIKNATTSVKMSDKGVGETYTLTKGGRQKIKIINEPNLYRLIFRSNKPEAQKFANWVYEEVLPQIRQTGKCNVATQPDLFVAPSSKRSVISFDRLSLAQLFKEAQDENVAYQIDHFHHREFIEATEAIRKFGIACYDLGTLDAVYNLKEKGRIKEGR